MNPIQTLMDEHRLIERMIDALSGYAASVKTGDDLPREDLVGFVRFIREFADAHHHGKEEDILFRHMGEQGMPTEMGPLAVMLQEHTEGRGYTQALAAIAEGDGAYSDEDRTQLAWAAGAYAGLLRAHIQKEDQVLYPMADSMFAPPVWAVIEREFEAFESEASNAERARALRAEAETLVSRYTG